jgi:hypothetical protein
MYPDLGGPFQSVDEAEGAMAHPEISNFRM